MSDYKYVPQNDRIKIHPLLGVRANAQDHGAGWRFWVVCRSLDAKAGSGVVSILVVNEYLRDHGVNGQQIRRWMDDACKIGFVKQVTRHTGVVILLYASETEVAVKLGCNKVDVHFVEMDMSQVLEKNWRSEVWEAFIGANFNGKTISRERIQAISGVERHQQRRLEKNTNIKNIRNVVITDVDADASKAAGMSECEGRAAYVYKGKIAFRLPDTRKVEGIEVYGRERSKKINEKIEAISGESVNLEERGALPRALSTSSKKLFHDDQEEANKYLKKASIAEQPLDEVFYVAPEQGDYKYKGGVRWKMIKKEVKK